MEEQSLSFAHLASEPIPPPTEGTGSTEAFAWEAARAQWTARRPAAATRSPVPYGGKNLAAKLVSGGV